MKKKLFLVITTFAMLLASCNNKNQDDNSNNSSTITKSDSVKDINVKDMSFDELFKQIKPEEISYNVFKLVGQDYTVITAGTDSLYNSMTASWGGWGQLFDKPSTWCFLNAGRYTLEFIKQQQTYTMTYFPEDYKEQVIAFGSKSGRDSEKMQETSLTHVKTPTGNISYKEAKLIIECKLTEITATNPNDFYNEKGKQFVIDGQKTGKDYHKIVLGEITNVWVRK